MPPFMITKTKAEMRTEIEARACLCPALPQFGLVMKVGPHSGMSLSDIAASKYSEQDLYGIHYWGYSGTLCHPLRVLRHVEQAIAEQGSGPSLLLSGTRSKYQSSRGRMGSYSVDGHKYRELQPGVQLQGAQFALVATNLRAFDAKICMDHYLVQGGKNDSLPLSMHMRGRINKACVRLSKPSATIPTSQRIIRLAYKADLVHPYVVWLRG
jgi:hypothetical protein